MATQKTKAGTEYHLISDVQYLPYGGEFQALDLYIPAGEAPARGWPLVIYAHGGAFKMGDKADEGPSLDFARMALDHGFAMASVNYRLFDMDEVEPEIEDVWAALRWLVLNSDALGVDRFRFAFLGASAGAALTASVAARASMMGGPWVAAVISISGAFHVTKTADDLHEDAPPFYIAHGTKDSAVSFSVAGDFRAALEKYGVPCKFVAAEGADHCRATDDPHIYRVLDEMGKLNDAYVWLRENVSF